jgi:hypothetical protein
MVFLLWKKYGFYQFYVSGCKKSNGKDREMQIIFHETVTYGVI